MGEIKIMVRYVRDTPEDVAFTDKEFAAIPHNALMLVEQCLMVQLVVIYNKGSPLCTPERVAEVVAKNYVRRNKGKMVGWELRIIN